MPKIAMNFPRHRATGARGWFLGLAIAVGGCAIASAPIQDTPKVVPTPAKGELAVSNQATTNVGGVTPVYVAFANGTETARTVTPSQIFALDSGGQRIAPLPPGEAARQAGGVGQLKAAMESGAASAGIGAVAGAGLGSLVGLASGAGAGTGAAVGSVIGTGVGGYHGVVAGQGEQEHQGETQVNAVALSGGDLNKDFTMSGYVFFPKGTYSGVEMLLVNKETGATETIKEPWR